MSYARGVLLLAALAAAASCDRSQTGDAAAIDTSSAAGDVATDGDTAGTVFHGLKYPITPENYRRWSQAQAALDSLEEATGMPRIELRDPTDDDIERTVNFLSSHDRERRAIEGSGSTVRDFVLTSIALGQAFHFSGDDLVPQENVAFVRANRAALVRAREARRFHVLDDDDDDDDGNGHGLGHTNGHQHTREMHKGKG